MPKIIFMGCTNFSKQILLSLLKNKFTISAIFSIPERFKISYCRRKMKNYNYADLKNIAKTYGINFYEVKSSKDIARHHKTVHDISPDITLVAGWYFMIPRCIRGIAKYGTWGVHGSLLPSYRGGAPLVWAIINGERKTGVTLFRLGNGVDNGDIIAQKSFPINFEDTIDNIYQKATFYSKRIILEALKNIDKVKFYPQIGGPNVVYPQREPMNGRIDLNDSVLKVYNFIRAQSKPYPGAFSWVNKKKITFWKVKYFKYIPDTEYIRIGEMFKKADKGFVRMKNGFLEILYCKYGSEEGEFYNIANKSNLWGRTLRGSTKVKNG